MNPSEWSNKSEDNSKMTNNTENGDESDNISSDVLEKLEKLGPNRYEAMAREVENAREAETTDGDTGEAETDVEDNGTDDDDRQR
jgi:hypothetical protein